MKRLIVNADDFGMAESVNQGISAAHTDGILTSASLLANGPAFRDATNLARQLPRLSVGLHVNLSQGKPISPVRQISTLVNAGGKLHLAPFPLWLGMITRRVRLEHIQCEINAQIRKLFDSGITPTHLDGHLHVHVLPQIFPLLTALAREFDIPYVRCPVENVAATLPLLLKSTGPRMAVLTRSVVAYAISSSAHWLREKPGASGVSYAHAFLGLAHTGYLDEKTLRGLLALVPDGTTELMCHPGYNSQELTSLGGELVAQREAEVAALTSPEVKEALDSFGVLLTNFRELPRSPARAPGISEAHF